LRCIVQRLALQQLQEWQRSPLRKPLILQGARQTGKTYLVTEFAKQSYENFVYCNFEENLAFSSMFDKNLDPALLIENLNLYHGTSIKPEKTLIIFDEIQVSQRAITSLKYFNEKANQYHIIAAGSLLGVSIGQNSSFPVGKVDFMDLYPLNFLEYLIALGESGLADLLINKKDFLPLAEPIHEKLTNFFRTFLFIGGMPEVVSNYIEQKDIELAQKIQSLIIQSYNNDFSKYAEPNESIRISNVWQSIPFQLAKENKKFTLADIESGARLSRYELAFEWLRKAGLIYLAYNTTTGKAPIKSYINSKKFKLYYLDTGLLTACLKAPPEIAAVVDSLYTEFKGALIENYVAKELFP